MYSRTRVCVYAGLLVALAGSALRAGCSCFDPDSGWGGLPVLGVIQAEHERAMQLDAEHEIVERNTPAADRIRLELYDGRLSLLQAVADFRAATTWWPRSFQDRIDEFPGSTAEERYCRYLIQRARTDLENDPRGEAVVARLEAQFQEYLTGRAPQPIGKTIRKLSQEGPERSAIP
jgi:hypothetical protein